MSEHISDQLIEQYCRRKISPEELSEMSVHLTACEDCRQRLQKQAGLEQVYQKLHGDLQAAALADLHPGYKQLSAFIKGELDVGEHRQLETHLRSCRSCSNEADDLREFAGTINRHKTYAPPVSTWEKFLRLWRGADKAGAGARFSMTQKSLLAGVAFASLMMAVAVGWQLVRVREATPVAKTGASPTPAIPTRTPEITSSPTPQPSGPVSGTEIASLRVSYSDVSYRGADEAVAFRIPANATQGRITITSIKDDSPVYSALLLSNAGERIVIPGQLKPRPGQGGRNVDIPVPVTRLKNNQTYKLILKGGDETVASFSIRVRKG